MHPMSSLIFSLVRSSTPGSASLGYDDPQDQSTLKQMSQPPAANQLDYSGEPLAAQCFRDGHFPSRMTDDELTCLVEFCFDRRLPSWIPWVLVHAGAEDIRVIQGDKREQFRFLMEVVRRMPADYPFKIASPLHFEDNSAALDLFNALQGKQVKALDLVCSAIGASGLRAIADFLTSSASLERLDVSGRAMEDLMLDPDAQDLFANALASNTGLESLTLAFDLNARMSAKIFKSVVNHPTLCDLDILKSKLDAEACTDLEDLALANPELHVGRLTYWSGPICRIYFSLVGGQIAVNNIRFILDQRADSNFFRHFIQKIWPTFLPRLPKVANAVTLCPRTEDFLIADPANDGAQDSFAALSDSLSAFFRNHSGYSLNVSCTPCRMPSPRLVDMLALLIMDQEHLSGFALNSDMLSIEHVETLADAISHHPKLREVELDFRGIDTNDPAISHRLSAATNKIKARLQDNAELPSLLAGPASAALNTLWSQAPNAGWMPEEVTVQILQAMARLPQGTDGIRSLDQLMRSSPS